MTFSSEAEKPSSNRYMLMKITPARYVSDDLSAAGGGVYDMGWSYNIDRIERNGTALTEASSTPGTNDQWYWDGSSLEIKLASAPSSSNIIVVFYNLFYTSGEFRTATVDPEDSNTPEVHWEPRLLEEPAVRQSIKDLISGVLATAITSLKLSNPDNGFQAYLTDNDSFYEKTVKCWFCINGVENIQKAFEGRIKSVSLLSDSSVTLEIYDVFSLLDQPCLMGDSAEEAYFVRETGSFPDVDPAKAGITIPYIASKLSRYKKLGAADMIEIESTNKYLDWSDTDGTLAASVDEGFYSPDDLANAMAAAMNAVASTNTYSVTYFTTRRKFIFEEATDSAFTILWNTGSNNGSTIAMKMGFWPTADTASAFVSIGGVAYTGVFSDIEIPFPVNRLDSSSLIESACTDYAGFADKESNRVWSVARFNSDGPRELNFDIQVGSDTKTQGPMLVRGEDSLTWRNLHMVNFTGSDNNIRVGDSFKWTNNGATKSCYAMCVRDQSFTYGINTYTHAFIVIDQSTKNGYEFLTLNSGDTWSTNSAPAVVLVENSSGKSWPLFYEKHFSTNETTLASGNIYQSITLIDGVEDDLEYFHQENDYLLRDYPVPETTGYSGDTLAGYRPANAINPSDYSIYVRTGAATDNLGHAEVIKEMVEKAGLSTNAASFSTAQSALDVNTSFQIPQFDETDYSSYRKYLELICASTMGVLYANNSFELEYALLSTPSSSNVLDDKKYRTLSIKIDYQDIVTQLIAYNPHNSSQDALDAAYSPSETVSSDVTRYLHGVRVTRRFRHVLETITARIQDIFDILSKRRAVYRFTTATEHLDAEIGDDFQLESEQLLGASGSKDLKIISLDKSAQDVVVEASDLLDI